MKTILVPTDFSDQATYALDLAYDIAKKSGAAIKVLNVVEAPPKVHSVPPEKPPPAVEWIPSTSCSW